MSKDAAPRRWYWPAVIAVGILGALFLSPVSGVGHCPHEPREAVWAASLLLGLSPAAAVAALASRIGLAAKLGALVLLGLVDVGAWFVFAFMNVCT